MYYNNKTKSITDTKILDECKGRLDLFGSMLKKTQEF